MVILPTMRMAQNCVPPMLATRGLPERIAMIIPEQARSPKIVELSETISEEQAALRALLEQRRPAWVPDYVGDDYDRDPYAYQTRRELMPEGADHNEVAS